MRHDIRVAYQLNISTEKDSLREYNENLIVYSFFEFFGSPKTSNFICLPFNPKFGGADPQRGIIVELPKLLKEVIINGPEGKFDRVLKFQLRHSPTRLPSLRNTVV